MKLLITLLILSSLNALAAKPPEQSTVDQYVYLALNLSNEQLQGNGKFTCEYAVVLDSTFTSQGKSLMEAQTNVALRCIKNKCNQMPSLLAAAHLELTAVGDEELALLMKGLGHTQEEINNALSNRKNPDADHTTASTCAEGSSTLRAFAVDSCFAIPMQCFEN
ncbi:MAG: hypothetical protein V4596_07425 [Bdellovibrionota bacterium]